MMASPTQFLFITNGAADLTTKTKGKRLDTQRIVRVKVMKEFKRRQRNALQDATVQYRPCLLARRNPLSKELKNRHDSEIQQHYTSSFELCPQAIPLHTTNLEHVSTRDLSHEGCEVYNDGKTSIYPDIQLASTPLRMMANNQRGACIPHISDTEAWREHLLQVFLTTHFPDKMPHIESVSWKLRDWFGAHPVRAMTAATECILLHTLAVHSKDKQHLWAAKRKYAGAIMLLRKALEKPDRPDTLFYAVDALSICEGYKELSSGPDTWRLHARGLNDILCAKGPAVFDQSIGLLVLDSICIVILDGLLIRKQLPFLSEKWQRAMSDHCTSSLHYLFHAALPIPGFLERVDAFKIAGGTDDAKRHLMQDLSRTEAILERWRRDWYDLLPAQRLPYKPVSKGSLDFGDMTEICQPPPPLEYVYEFASLVEATTHNIYWTLLLTVRSAILDVMRIPRPGSQSKSTSEVQRADLPHKAVSSATECALSLCCSAPYLIRELQGVAGGRSTVVVPLSIAGQILASLGNEALSRWCFSVRDVCGLDSPGANPLWITRPCLGWLTSVI